MPTRPLPPCGAIAAGWRDRDQLREDPDLASLRDRDDFRALMGEALSRGTGTATLTEQWRAGQLALAECERRARELPQDATRQGDLAAAHRSIGLVQVRLGQTEPGLESLRNSIAIRERLVQEESSGHQARVQLAQDLAALVDELWRADSWRDSRVTADPSLRVWERVLRDAPDDAYFRAETAAVRACRACAVFQTGKLDETRRLFEQARASFDSSGGADHRVTFSKARVLALASMWQPGLGDRDRKTWPMRQSGRFQDALATGHRDDWRSQSSPTSKRSVAAPRVCGHPRRLDLAGRRRGTALQDGRIGSSWRTWSSSLSRSRCGASTPATRSIVVRRR